MEARSAAEGLALARAGTGLDGFTLVTGSDYLVGELLREAEDHDEPDLSGPRGLPFRGWGHRVLLAREGDAVKRQKVAIAFDWERLLDR